MKAYDLIAIGTGSAMNIVEAVLQRAPEKTVAVIDKDDPGGICLTRGCIPTKILVYPAEIVRGLDEAKALGIDVQIKHVDFQGIMARMRSTVGRDVEGIRRGLTEAKGLDYYPGTAEFVGPHRLKVNEEEISAKMIFLCLGSRPTIPPIEGLAGVAYQTSDTILELNKLPATIAILGGGYIAAEYGHFFSAMGSQVTIIGRNPQFLPKEEPEVAELAKREMSKHLTLLTNHEVVKVEASGRSKKKIVALDRTTGKEKKIVSEVILVAAGRTSNTDILKPERAGIKTNDKGWILVDEYLETSQANIWALGDATGRHQFKHAANYESKVVYYNAILGQRMKADYHAIPHAVFCTPEIASVGVGQKEAVDLYGEDGVLIGFHRYRHTAKGEAMGLKDPFVKAIVEAETNRILGAHIIGPQASVLIQEIITLMYTPEQSTRPILSGMHIHPALSEVVERAFISLMPAGHYRHLMEGGGL